MNKMMILVVVMQLSRTTGNASHRNTVAIIGGGVSGMAAARHLLDPIWGMNPTLFELSDTLGGTWIYTNQTGVDEYGIPIQTSMYKNLKTNLPKEIMMFPDFPHKKQGLSYITNEDVCHYLADYAKFADIMKCVKLRHLVKLVDRVDSKWKVVVKNLKAGLESTHYFDYVIVAVGQTSVPKYPTIEGIQYFKGETLHSHDYREPNRFRNLRVLLIGAGPSGLDITFDLSSVTNHIALSHHSKRTSQSFPSQVVLKPDVERISTDGSVIFVDGTSMEFDVIVYCTGYCYSFPFLSGSCGIKWDNKYVRPLYKRVININQPTMGFIGAVRKTILFYIADLQARFFLSTLVRPELLPSKKEMIEELDEMESQLEKSGRKTSDYLALGDSNADYVKNICNISGITQMPEILLKMYDHAHAKLYSDFKNFRNNIYKIVDQDNFSVVDIREVNAKPVVRVHENSSCRILPNV